MDAKNMIVYSGVTNTAAEIFNTKSKFNIIAGPCAVESLDQMDKIARALISNDIKILRGGAFKPRTSPYDFQGLGKDGLRILKQIAERYRLQVVSEIMDPRDIEIAMDYIDIIQIGSRNMHNTSLLKEVGKTKLPILLKRGLMSTVSEFLLATEYILLNGNKNVVLCERGIRTFENSTRNTLDISCVAIVKNETNLPIIVDLSHSLGRKDIVLPVARAVVAAGADGVMIEIHNEPQKALSDSMQQLDLYELNAFMSELKGVLVKVN